jgi:type IV pilus assembly protein PilV
MISAKKTQQGFTLLESLLTLFILAVGMLGVAGLQMQSLRSGSVALQRMAVSIKAHEMMDRVRANMISRVGKNAGEKDYSKVLTARQVTLDSYATASGVDAACINGTICTADQIAAYDIFQWEREMAVLLPGTPTSVITVTGTSMTVNVSWQDRGETYSYTVTSQI